MVQAPSLYEGNLLQSLLKGGEVGLYTMRGFHNELRAKLPDGALRSPGVSQLVNELLLSLPWGWRALYPSKRLFL